MTFLKMIFMAVMAASFGSLSSAGVFTVLASIGLVPRFAGRFHISKYVFVLEEMVVLGTIVGCVFSVFGRYMQIGSWMREHAVFGNSTQAVWSVIAAIIIIMFGAFAGMFIGCLALAIAEMLDSIPIFTRRIGFRHGLGIVILAMAAGKLIGSLLYFAQSFYLVLG